MVHAVGQADTRQGVLGLIGLVAISVIKATFSRAVRLGTRLKNWKMKPTFSRR
jgi:hypothetical protein